MSVYVRFDCEIRLYGEDVPEKQMRELVQERAALSEREYETIAEAVQRVLGHTGAVCVDVVEYEDDGCTP